MKKITYCTDRVMCLLACLRACFKSQPTLQQQFATPFVFSSPLVARSTQLDARSLHQLPIRLCSFSGCLSRHGPSKDTFSLPPPVAYIVAQ